MRKPLKVAATIATAAMISISGAQAASAQTITDMWPYISNNNGDPLYNSPINENQLPGSSKQLHKDGYLDEALVGIGIAAIAAVVIGVAVVNQANLDQGLNGAFTSRIPHL